MGLEALWWLLFNLFWIAVLAYFSMIEMAAVSFNKVRLQYYVSKKMKRAIWLNNLLQDPSRLFGTTLIGVSIATVICSECGRQVFSSLGLNPDFAPLPQVVMVVIIGELAPMFAARRYAEHVSMLGIPLLYAISRLLKPLLWFISRITAVCQFFLRSHLSEEQLFLSQEELLKIVEDQEDLRFFGSDTEEFNAIASNIFKLRHIAASDIMKPITQFKMLSSNNTVGEMREILAKTRASFFPIFHRKISNIVGIAFPRDMIRASCNHRARDYSRNVWFITLNTGVMEILHQFKRNRQSVGVVINEEGAAIGLIPLDTLIDVIIGPPAAEDSQVEAATQVMIDKTLPASMTVQEFYDQFEVRLSDQKDKTLADLIAESLEHAPEKGDSIVIEPYQLTVLETTLTDIKQIRVSTKIA